MVKETKFSQQSYKCFPILQYKFGVFCSIKRKICRIKRRIEVFRVCLELRFFGFFRCFFTSKNRLFDMLEKNRRFVRTKRRSILPKGRFTKIIRRFAVSKMSICRNRVSICGVFVGSSRVESRFSSLFCELSASFYRFLSH